jgi:tRNA(Ile)-lysidine synthase TilS/MesJ
MISRNGACICVEQAWQGSLNGSSHSKTWSQNIPLVRPLLSICREAILEYCAERGLHPIYDSSNQDLTYFRNRLRLELIPFLTRYNPAVKRLIWQSSEILKGDDEIIQRSVDEAWQICVLRSGNGWVVFDQLQLSRQPIGLQRRLFRQAIAELSLVCAISALRQRKALNFLVEITKPARLILYRTCGGV